MYRIAILTDDLALGQRLSDWTVSFCEEQGLFPLVELYESGEVFFSRLAESPPCSVILALPGVKGLNAAEHLRSLAPSCGLIWCSDLDFSLHAYKLRAEYFMLEPVSEATMREGLSAWLQIRQSS